MNLLTYPNPKLTTPCEFVDVLTDEDKFAIEEMKRICVEKNGYAIAANQIGHMRRIVVFPPNIDIGEDWLVLINPTWIPFQTHGQVEFLEGCLSFPTIRQQKKRWDRILVNYVDVNKIVRGIDCDGLMSIAIQHECEHLDGKTFIDDLSKLKRERIQSKLEKMKR